MQKSKISLSVMLFVILIARSSFCPGQDNKNYEIASRDTSVSYKDGTYIGQSRASYTGEPYWGSVKITLKDGSFTSINFIIRDSSLHETFNENYEKHFQGNPVYIDQCRKDWKGVQTYPVKLSETRNPEKIDAMSGATWSYNIFKASVKEALEKAK
jgi:major membrane immunogen (membrane-anchored lipoprotein)